LIKLRTNLIIVKDRYNLNISIPTDTPLTIDKEIDLTENKDSDSSEGIEIKEKDLHDLTIPAVITVTEAEEEEDKESDISVPDIKENILADPAAQRAYIKDISNAIPEFNGQKIHLQRFITALMLVYLTKGTFEDMAVEVIKSKIIGFTPTANVINKIESKIIDTDLSNILSIIVFIMSPYILYKAYMYHKKCVSKRAINRSQANDLDKI